MNRRLLTLVLAALVALGATACGQDRSALTVYSGRTQNLVGPILERFAEDTGIDIDVKYGDTAELALLLAQEGENTDADVFLAQNPGAEAFLADEGRLTTLDQELLDLVDEAYRSADGNWVGVTGRQRVLVYNQDLVDAAELPSSVFELTEPEYAGRVGVAPENGSFQDFVSAMVVTEGEEATLEWLTAMADSGAPTYPNNNAIVEATSRGEIPMGLVNHYYNHRFLAEDPSLPSRNHRFASGDLGSLVISSGVSILEGTDQQDAADEFVRYLLSEDAQEYFAGETFEYPLAAGVEPSADLPPLDPQALPEVDYDALGDTLRTTTELIARSGLSR
jgi:iron(III) transport system substrate-binding protein